MTTNLPPEEVRFAKNVVVLAQAVHKGVTDLYEKGYQTVNPTLVGLVVGVLESYDKEVLIQGFIANSHLECWDKILERKENFFVENADKIFADLPASTVGLFKDLFLTKDELGNSVVSKELKDKIWTLFDQLVKVSIKYIHRKRGPSLRGYTLSFFDEVDIGYHVAKWKVSF